MSYFPLIPRHWPSFLNVWIGLSHRKPDRCELVSLTWVYRKSNLKQLFESVLILLWNQFFLVFYLYLPIEVVQRGKMARGGGTHLLLVWPGFGFADLASHVHVGWVCCWFMCLLWGFFFGASGFPPSTKPTFQIPIQPASSGKEEPPSGMSFAEFPFIYLFYLIEIKRWGSKLNKN